MKRLLFTICIFLVLFVLIIASIPFINNLTASQVVKEIEHCPLPQFTTFCESVSVAGKLAGNGNGMQFFGAILIKSELSLNELEEYYSQYRKGEWSFVVFPQSGNEILAVENQKVCFSSLENETDYTNYFVVYSWGSSDFPLCDFDLRGH